MMENLYNKYGRKKVFILMAVLLVFLHIIFMGLSYQRHIRFTFDGHDFKYTSDSDGYILFKDKEGDLLKIILEDGDGNFSLSPIGSKYRIEYKDKSIGVDYGNWPDGDTIITTSEGKEYRLENLLVHFSYSELPEELGIIEKLEDTYDFVRTNSIYSISFLSIVLILVGLGEIIYTRELWKFQYIFTVKNGEPTDWALASSKIAGFLFIFFALASPFIF